MAEVEGGSGDMNAEARAQEAERSQRFFADGSYKECLDSLKAYAALRSDAKGSQDPKVGTQTKT